MRTSIDLPDSLFRRLKKLAAERGVAMRDVVVQALTSHMEAPQRGHYTFDWKVDHSPWNPDLPIDNNAALLDLLDPVERYMAPPPAPAE